MPIPHLLVHHKGDNVGVVVIEGVTAGTELLGVILENDTSFHLKVNKAVPLGHKVALADLGIGETIIKYGQDIGRLVATVVKGDHIHVHNLKTKRW